MAMSIVTLKNKKTGNIEFPRTKVQALSDSDENVLDKQLKAGDINILKNGKISQMEVEIDGKANKATLSVSGHLAGLDSNGNLTDSGIDKKAACYTISITSLSTTLEDVYNILNEVNTNEEHILLDVSALGASMYLCTAYIDGSIYRIVDLVSGRLAEGAYESTKLLAMVLANADQLATQSQIDTLQEEIDELGGKSLIKDWDTLGDHILAGDSTDYVEPGDMIDVNWIKTVTGTSSVGNTVTCTDIQAFVDAVGEAEESTYLFVYDGSSWTYKEASISLETFGLSITGTVVTGEIITINTTVDAVSYTFTGYDDMTPSDTSVPHNWLLEQTYAPSTKVFDIYESLFCIQANKSVPAGKYYLQMYSYRSGKYFNACFELASDIGTTTKIQMSRNASSSADRVDRDGNTVTGVWGTTSLKPLVFGTTTSAGSNITITYMSTADAEAGGYTDITTLNNNDVAIVIGDMDKSALGNNCWFGSNLDVWLNKTTSGDDWIPSHDNDIASSYNRGVGFMYGMDPRVKNLIQYADIKNTMGYGNNNRPHYEKASGTAPATDAPIYYERTGEVGEWVYTELNPQPEAGSDISSYYVYKTTYTQGVTYTDERKVFLLSMKEMSFNIQTSEGNITDLYGKYTNNTLTNGAVAARAKYNKAGGTLNTYRWSRSSISAHAYGSWFVHSTGANDYHYAYYGFFCAPAFIIGKKS